MTGEREEGGGWEEESEEEDDDEGGQANNYFPCWIGHTLSWADVALGDMAGTDEHGVFAGRLKCLDDVRCGKVNFCPLRTQLEACFHTVHQRQIKFKRTWILHYGTLFMS